MNVKTEICNAFNAQAPEYGQAAKIQGEIGERLFCRLEYLKIKPQYILDLGCGTGRFTKHLQAKYRDAQIIGLDLAYGMLAEADRQTPTTKCVSWVNADTSTLPFPSGLFDLVFSNQVVHWVDPISSLLSEVNRVMRPEGCFMFSTLGPDTFVELRQAWSGVDRYAHTNRFMDMHNLGDALLADSLLDPVVDMEVLHAHYASLSSLIRSLKLQGVRNINPARNKGLTGKQAWNDFEQSYLGLRTLDGKFPLTYEVIYGHAWKGKTLPLKQETETKISFDILRDILKHRTT